MSFAILTANANERKAVRHFLQLGNPIDTTQFPHAEGCVFETDSFLVTRQAIIKPHEDNEKNRYPLFYLEVGQKRQVGVHVPCDTMGPWGAFNKTVELLRMAKDKGWKLRYIFVVGCCGARLRDRNKCKEDCPRGTVLLARQVKDYLNTGKVKDGRVDGNPLTHDMGDEWLEDLKVAQEATATKGNEAAATKGNEAAAKSHRIAVETVNYLTGPLVIKDDLFGKPYCEGNAKITGVEMEVAGVIRAVETFYRITDDPKQKVMLVKGVSDYTGNKGEKARCMLFGRDIPAVDDDQLQVYATLQSLALVIRFVAGNIQRI